MWFWVFLVLAGVAGVGVVIYAVFQGRGWSKLSAVRFYDASRETVSAAAARVVGDLGYAISRQDGQAISFTSGFLGEGAGVAPVVHAVILPVEDARTRVEVVGARGPGHYVWHAMRKLFSRHSTRLCPVTLDRAPVGTVLSNSQLQRTPIAQARLGAAEPQGRKTA